HLLRPARAALADRRNQPDVEPRAIVPRRLQHRRQRSAPDAGSRGGDRYRRGQAMRKAWAILAVALVVALSVAAVGALRRDTASSPLPTAIVAKTTFVDFLQLRGEIRPVRSVVLTAPSAGSDLQIVELATNGAKVAADEVVITFD